ncbi:MAG: universal stress protein [Anaerolineae bacterium]
MIRTILVPLDGSALGEGALPTATALAQRMGAQLVLARVVSSASPLAVGEAQTYLDRVRARLPHAVAASATALHGPPAPGILAAVAGHRADMVVMTTHGYSGLRRLVFGSVAEKVLATSPAPVWLVPAHGTAYPPLLTRPAPLALIPLDGSALAEAALPPALMLVNALGARLLLLRVLPPEPLLIDPGVAEALAPTEDETPAGAEAYLETLVPGIEAQGIPTQFVVRRGPAIQTILDEIWASGADLLIMATHGRSGLDRAMLGSVAVGLIHACTIPMLLTRPEPPAQGDNQKTKFVN